MKHFGHKSETVFSYAFEHITESSTNESRIKFSLSAYVSVGGIESAI